MQRGLGLGRIKNLKPAANSSVGIRDGSELAKMELKLLLTQYEWLQNKLEELESKLDELLVHIPHVKQLLAIKGIGRDTIAGFLAEVGDIDTRWTSCSICSSWPCAKSYSSSN